MATKNKMMFMLASTVSVAPFMAGALAWMLSLPTLKRFGLGILLGIVMALIFHLSQLYRSHERRIKVLQTQQMCYLNNIILGRLVGACEGSFPCWITQVSDFEKVTWLNKQLEEIWPSLNEAASCLLKEILQSVLDPYKFSIIQNILVRSVTLGTLSPLISGIKFREAGPDESILEVELDWRHGQDSKFVIQLQTTGPPLTVEVKNITFSGVLQLTFKPLKDQFPGFGAITLSLKDLPVMDFQTKFLGGDVLMIPGVDNAVDNIIMTALLDSLVWPNRLVVPILEGDYSFLELKPVGLLEIKLLEAKDLANKDFWSQSDPFVTFYIRRKEGCIETSSIKSNTNSPIWNEQFTLHVEDLETQKLTIRVLDHDPYKAPDFIGICELPLIQFIPNQDYDIWVNLVADIQKPEGKFEGSIHLIIVYKPFSLGGQHKVDF